MDPVDIRILAALQTDASRSIAELAEKVHTSQNTCWRRIKRLEEEGYVDRRVALLDPAKLGLSVTVFTAVRAGEHTQGWLDSFALAVRDIPEIVGVYRMSGDVDYLLRIYVEDVAGYDAVYKQLIRKVKLTDVSSAFVMEELKQTTALPLSQLSHPRKR